MSESIRRAPVVGANPAARIRATRPGAPPRNGLPARQDYAYRGTGASDPQLDAAWKSDGNDYDRMWAAHERRRRHRGDPAYCLECGYRLASVNHRAWHQLPEPADS